MPWVRIDEQFVQHPKVIQVGPLGMVLQLAGLCYANTHLTDGFIPHGAIRTLLDFNRIGENVGDNVELWCEVGAFNIVERLVAVGMWIKVEGGYQIHDFEDYQPPRTQVLAEREKTRQRVAKHRAEKRSGNPPRNPGGNAVTTTVASSNGRGNAVTNTRVTPHPVPGPVSVTETLRANTDTQIGLLEPAIDSVVEPPARPVSVDRQVFDFWREHRHKRADVRFSDGRRAAVQRALKVGYTTDDCFDAIRGMALDPWPDRPQHDDLTDALHLGTAKKPRNNLEYFRNLWRNGAPPASNGRRTVFDHARRRMAEAQAREEAQR